MNAAPLPRSDREAERLLVLGPTGVRADTHVGALVHWLREGDVLVVNDAATLPASLPARTASGEPVEIRLAAHRGGSRFVAALLGAGDFRTRTEHRPPPPRVEPGDRLDLGGPGARVVELSPISPRLVELIFDGDAWSAIYARGRPVQYAHTTAPLHLFDVQTAYAGRPWAVELPSAGRPLTWSLLGALRRKGVRIAALTHAAGLSATGDPALDAALPLPERYEIPVATVRAVAGARRVIAAGTTVVRALEGCTAAHGTLRPGAGETDLRIGPAFRPRVAHGLLTGIHEPGTSHFELMGAFAPAPVLEDALRGAAAAGYLTHEFGDSMLLLP